MQPQSLIERDKQARLVQRLKLREPLALEELYDIYGVLCYAVIQRVVRNQCITEDLVQETFLRVWKYAGSFDAQREVVGPWLMKVARNCALDYVRSSRERDDQGDDGLDQTPHPNPLGSVEKSVSRSLWLQALVDASRTLSIQQRAVIDLAYFGGYSQTEIAARLGRPLGTVKSWSRSALQAMRVNLQNKSSWSTVRKPALLNAE